MEIRIFKRVNLGSFVRLTFTNAEVSISFGHRSIGWLTIGKRGLSETIDTPIGGVYFRDNQPWNKVLKALRLRK
jgi:hypothetical protein